MELTKRKQKAIYNLSNRLLKLKFTIHYWNHALCLVSTTLGKRQKTLGKGGFAECHLSSTRQRLCRMLI